MFGVGLVLSAPPALRAQTDVRVVEATPPIGPWHVAIEARAALRDAVRTEDVLRAAEAEITIGRPDRARSLLALYHVTDQRLEATAAFGAGDFARAGAMFSVWGEAGDSAARGILLARAGDAFERAGLDAASAASYRQARTALPLIAGWLALREARVSADTAAAFTLLDAAPPAGRVLIPSVRGELLARSGDTARAVAVLAGAGFDGRAARLALASGDSAGARLLAYRALRAGDTAVAAVGVDLARNVFRPSQPAEFLTLARAVRRESPALAADLAGQAVARGDVSVGTLITLGDIRSEAGHYDDALDAYQRAAGGSAPESAGAQFSVARTLLRLGRPLAAAVAVSAFLSAHPTHQLAPMATFLQADLSQEAGRRAEAESLSRQVVERWPTHDYASQARLRLAANALSAGDTAVAARWYQAEVDARGLQHTTARYFLAVLAVRRGDSVAAGLAWRDLARADSLGYFGGVARGRASLPLPIVAPAVPLVASRALERSLAELDLLDEAGFASEAGALIAWLLAQNLSADEALDLGDALAHRGRPTVAITLGWRAARTRTLNDARVLRAIYPWPLRAVVSAEAREFGLDEYLLAALIRQESSFDPLARSRAGARGMMQVMPGTARQAAQRGGVDWSDLFLRVPDANIHVGSAHLAALLRHYGGDVAPSLAAYNAGMTPVERWRRRFPGRDPVQFTDRIPYAETRGYVRTVLRNWSLYRILYPAETTAGMAGGT